jgi:hypothetical protein
MELWKSMVDEPILKPIEKLLSSKLAFSLIVITQGLMGGTGLVVPELIQTIIQNKLVQFVLRTAIAFTATQNLTYAMSTVLILEVVFYLVSTDKERAKQNSLIHQILHRFL